MFIENLVSQLGRGLKNSGEIRAEQEDGSRAKNPADNQSRQLLLVQNRAAPFSPNFEQKSFNNFFA